MFGDILGLSPAILLVLALLIGFSVVSWGIIILKLLQIGRVKKSTKVFLDHFWTAKEFALIDPKVEEHLDSPLAAIFQDGYQETGHFLELTKEPSNPKSFGTDKAIENISRSLRKVSAIEIEKLEKSVSFLATTASTSPFVGLFGTVWGIMNAFQSIGEAGSTSLAIVAPGISEALVTTAIGLAVAIPAVIGFNYLQSKIGKLISEIDNFSYDFLNIVQRIINAKK